MNEDPSDETSENDTMGGPAHDAPKATSARALCEIAGNPSALDSGDLFGAATNAIKAWDELTDTTHPRAFGRMKDAMEKLRDAVEDHQAAEAGRVVDAMAPEQVNAYLVSMGVNLEELRAHTEEMRAKIETKLGKPDALAHLPVLFGARVERDCLRDGL
jgi:hypothetical protein